jgi:glycosyltransferase involved in cell wall biosynthesis
MPSVVLLVPGSLDTRTGGYGYDREIVAGLSMLGWTVDVRTLDGSFPFPTPEARAHATATLASLPDGMLVLADGLAFGAMAEDAEREAARLRFVGLVHHPLALENGLDAVTAAALVASERRALATTRGVVVTSSATVDSLAPYAVPADRIVVVRPGTAPGRIARGTRGVDRDAPVELLCVATLTIRKGHDVLFAALARLASLRWHLTCAGGDTLHPATTAALRAQVAALGFADRVSFSGSLDAAALDAAYDRADVFVLPTRHEGYGMAVAEAVARGLPVVSTPTGAIAELVDDTSGILVPIDDVDGLASALARVIGDDAARGRLAAGAHVRRQTVPTWADAARLMADALTRFAR